MPSRSVKKRRKSRKQRGGAVFSDAQLATLSDLGFSDEEKTEFSGLLESQAANEPGLPASVITFARIYLEQINPQTGRKRTPRELIDYHIELHSDEASGGKRRRKSRKQRGGTRLTNEQINFLGRLGFTDEQKNALGRIVEPLNDVVTNMLVTAARDDIRRINPQTGVNFTPQNLIDNIRNTVGNVGGGKRRRKSKKIRKQRGGTRFSEAQLTELGTLSFNDEQKNALTRHLGQLQPDDAMMLIRQSLQQINPQTGQPFTPQGLIDSLDDDEDDVNELSDIENDSDDEHNLSDDDELHAILNGDDEEPMTPPPRTEGGRRRRRKTRKQRGGTDFTNVKNELRILGIVEDDDIRKLGQIYTVGPNDAIDTIRTNLRLMYPGQAVPYTQAQIQDFIHTFTSDDDNDFDDEAASRILSSVDGGRRRRKSRKTRKGKKSKKLRKMKGGAKYGTGVGANNFDPNYSIYNTRALDLFPYKPN
jgi:hypothetical protein